MRAHSPRQSFTPALASVRALFAAGLAAGALLAPVAASAQATPADEVLNRYYELKATEPGQAFDYLLENEPALREDVRVELELAYFLIGQERYAEALPHIEAATEHDPARAELWTQLGYVRLELDQREDALAAFDRSLALAPADKVALQRAFILQRLGRNREAAASFHELSGSPAVEVAKTSCAAWRNLYNATDRVFEAPYFGEVYLAPEYNSHWDLGVFPIQARVGAVLSEEPLVEGYAGLRAGLDTRSGNGPFGTQLYNDNAAIVSAGLRVRPIDEVPLYFFAEAGTAYDITYRGRDRWRGDVRGGAVFYDEWNMAPPCMGEKGGVRPVADFYAEGIYYSRYDDNVLFYLRARPGMRIAESDTHAVDLYALGAVGFDTRGVNYNNFEELGGGIALKLYKPAGLSIRGEGVRVFRHSGLASYSTLRVRVEYQSRF